MRKNESRKENQNIFFIGLLLDLLDLLVKIPLPPPPKARMSEFVTF